MALGSTQPLTEMSTRSISWGKSGRCVRLTTLPPSCAVAMKSGNLNFLQPSGPLQACNGTALPFFTYSVQQEAIKCGRMFIRKQILPLEQKQVSLTPAEPHSFGETEKNSERSYTL